MMVRAKRDRPDDEAVESGPSESVPQNEDSAEQESQAFDLKKEFSGVLPDFWERDLEAALEEVQQVVNDELGRQYGQLKESLRDLFYELFNYSLERPWRDSLAIFAEHWTDRGLKLTPRTLDAISRLIAEELDDGIAVELAEAGPTAGVADETEPAERAAAGEQSKGHVQSDADDASRATSDARNTNVDQHVDNSQANVADPTGLIPLTFGRIANFVYEKNYYEETLVDGPIRFAGTDFSGESIGGVSPDIRNLKVEIVASPQTAYIRFKTLDLPMPIKITRSYNGKPFTIAEINSIRAHEQKHLNAYKPPMTHVFVSIQQVNALVRQIRNRQLRLAVAQKLAPILETDANNFLVRRLNIEDLRQLHHFDFFGAKLRDIQKGRLVERNRTYGGAFDELLAKQRRRVLREFANQGVQLDPTDVTADVAGKTSARVNYYDKRYDVSIAAIKRAVEAVIAKQP